MGANLRVKPLRFSTGFLKGPALDLLILEGYSEPVYFNRFEDLVGLAFLAEVGEPSGFLVLDATAFV